MKADLAIYTHVLGVPGQYESVALMLSHKMDFYCCANRDGFHKSSHIYAYQLQGQKQFQETRHACACACISIRDEPILLLFSPIFLSGDSFIFSLLCSKFCSKLNILLKV